MATDIDKVESICWRSQWVQRIVGVGYFRERSERLENGHKKSTLGMECSYRMRLHKEGTERGWRRRPLEDRSAKK